MQLDVDQREDDCSLQPNVVILFMLTPHVAAVRAGCTASRKAVCFDGRNDTMIEFIQI